MLRPRTHLERITVGYVVSTTLAVVMVHGAASLLRAAFTDPGPVAALELSCATIIVGLLSAIAFWRLQQVRPTLLAAIVLSVVASTLLTYRCGGLSVAALVILLAGPIQASAMIRVARSLPRSLDGALHRRRRTCILWGLLGLLTILQTGRIGVFMSDADKEWGASLPHAWPQHMCMGAYIAAADYNRQGVSNVYDVSLYLPSAAKADLETNVVGLADYVEDPYQYPPPFLLLPRFALALTNDYATIRTVWFAIQALAFALVSILLASWIQGRTGSVALFLIPVVWISLSALDNFQTGQFHLSTLMLAVVALLAFETRRQALGGALLAGAIVSKISPVLVLIPLLIQRRWRAVGWTAAFVAGYTLLAWLVLGSSPFAAFLNYQLPNLQNGDAFLFAQWWPEDATSIIAANLTPYGMVARLNELGIPGMTNEFAGTVTWVYSLFILVLAIRAARTAAGRAHQAQVWLALLNLAVMRSPGAFNYHVVGSLWLLTLLAAEMRGRRWLSVSLGICWVFLFFLPGVVPLPVFPPPPAMMILSGISVVLMVTLNSWVILRRPPVLACQRNE